MSKNRYLVIIPAYNEAEEIEAVLEEIKNLKIDFIVIDDGSTDSTGNIAKRYGNVIELNNNQGKGRALREGFLYAQDKEYTHVIMFDSDGEKSVDDIPRFVSVFEKKESVDVVFGIRTNHRSVVRSFLNLFTRFWIRQAVALDIYDPLCGFVGIRVDSVMNMNLESKGFEIETEMALESGLRGLNYYELTVKSPKFTPSKLNFRDMVKMNLFYDRWVLRNINNLNLSLVRRYFLIVMCRIGSKLPTFFR